MNWGAAPPRPLEAPVIIGSMSPVFAAEYAASSAELIEHIEANVAKVSAGKPEAIHLSVLALIARGHF